MALPIFYQSACSNNLAALSSVSAGTNPGYNQGVISEVVYSEENPGLTQCLLLPLLIQLSQQSRWQLWLTSHHKLNRHWFDKVGLPVNKIMQAQFNGPQNSLSAMEKALRSGNFSVVICRTVRPLTEVEHQRLFSAAKQGNAIGLIMRFEDANPPYRPFFGLKIHSGLYH